MSDSSEDEAYYNKHQEEDLEQLVAQAVEAAAKGENVEQLLEVMLAKVSGPQKDKLRKKFAAALKKRNLKEPKGEAEVPSKNALAKLQSALAVSAKQAFDRVAALVRSRPDIAAKINQIGETLTKYGVTADRIQISESELGNISPNAVAKSQTRGDTGRGA